MNQIPQHPKLRGEWAEIQFLARASEHGLHVSKPYGDCLPYDFIVEHAGRMLRVQVKSTSYRCPGYTGYKCFVKPTKGKRYDRDALDFIAACILPEDVWYIIPFPGLRSKSTVHLDPANPRNRYRPYREAWHLLLNSEDDGAPYLPGFGGCGGSPSDAAVVEHLSAHACQTPADVGHDSDSLAYSQSG